MKTREPFIVKDLYCSPFQLLAGRHSSNILHPASLQWKGLLKAIVRLAILAFKHRKCALVSKGNIFVLLTEENIWSICHFGSCQVERKVHSVTLSASLVPGPGLTNTSLKNLRLYFFFLLGKWKNVSLINVGGAAQAPHWACCEACGSHHNCDK